MEDQIEKKPDLSPQRTRAVSSTRFDDFKVAEKFRDSLGSAPYKVRIRRRAGGYFDVVTYAPIVPTQP